MILSGFVAVMVSSVSTSSGDRVDRLGDFGVKTRQIILYLTSGIYTEGASENQKRLVRCQSKRYTYDQTSKYSIE